MIDKHEGVTDWEAAARIAMARADREAEAKVIILDFVEEMRDTLTMILGACGRVKRYDAEWQARVDRLEAALKHIVEVEAKAHATGKYSLAVEWCADKARTALAESEAAHG